MKDSFRKIVLACMMLLIIGAICSLAANNYVLTIFLASIVLVILLIQGIMYIFHPKSEEEMYNAFLKKIKKAFLTILVSSTQIPDLNGKTIVNVDNIDDLVDMSESMRKPIYYIEDYYVCDFILIHDNQACIYTLKAHDESVSKLEYYLKELEEEKDRITAEKIKDIDKTMIIEIPDAGLYRVSPVKGKSARDRKKKSLMENLQLPKLK